MSTVAAARGRSVSWLAGLDGLRATAVAAVVVFHFAPSALPGGFLGVDLFFVISGYLITRLLLTEIDTTGRLAIRDFYARRIRRLLPAVVTLLLVTATASALVWRDELPTTRGGVLASLGYVTNWWLIGDHQSYFVASGRPPMVQHLWSLAIEEQFYLFWPVVLVAVTGARLGRRRSGAAPGGLAAARLYRVVLVAAGLAGASTLAMAIIAITSDVPYGADSGRVYFGTGTHAMGLLLGAAAGAWSTRGPLPFGRRIPLLRGAFLTDVAAVVALVFLVRIVTTVDEFTPWLYRGGFLAVSALCVVVVAAAPRPTSLVGWAFDRAPLRWLGTRSYSVYLWHWPVAVVTRPDIDLTLDGWRLFLVRCTLTVGLAEASFRLIERPIRAGGLHGLAQAWGWGRLSSTARARLLPAAVAGVLVVAGSLISVFAYTAPRPALAAGTRPPPTAPANHPAAPALQAASVQRPVRQPTSTGHPTPGHPKPTSHPATGHPAPPAPEPAAVSAFGDSVMLGAASDLNAAVAHLHVSAVEGRQARDVFADIARCRAAGTLAPVVVIHAGDNGIISPGELSSTLRLLSDRRRVVVLTDRVPRDWQAPNNDMLRSTVHEFGNAVLVDWYSISNSHQDWFYKDGLHLTSSGRQAYTAAIVAAIR